MNLTLTMNARLSECLLLSYRTPARGVRHLVPEPLELVTKDGWAFWNVVACRTEGMRPAALPACLGVDYNQVAYRLHVKAAGASGQVLRGLYFVRTDAGSGVVRRFGNLLSDFQFHTTDVELSRARVDGEDVLTVAVQDRNDESGTADGLLRVALDGEAEARAAGDGSVFASAGEAERFLKYTPLALSLDLDRRWLKLAEVVRPESQWEERPVRVIEAHWNYLRALGQDDLHLERATRLVPAEYAWRLGRRLPASRVAEEVAPTVRRPAPAPRAAA